MEWYFAEVPIIEKVDKIAVLIFVVLIADVEFGEEEPYCCEHEDYNC